MFDMVKLVREYDGEKAAYDRSGIMKLAHEIKRIVRCTMGEALKLAWKTAHEARKCAHANASNYSDEVVCTVSIWAKYGKVRGYINGSKKNPNDKHAKYFDCRSYVSYAA